MIANNGDSLHQAAKQASLDMVRYFIEVGVDINYKNVRNETALHYAACSGSFSIVRYLVENGADVNSKNVRNKTPLHSAIESRSVLIVKYLIANRAEVCSSTLSTAARSGCLEIVNYLVQHGADINYKDVRNETPLHVAALYGYSEVVQYLVENGAEINCRSKINATALSIAVRAGLLDMVQYLVERGADVNLKCEWNKTVLHFAVHRGSLQMVEYFVEHGAKVTSEEFYGEDTILYLAVIKGNGIIVDYLLQHGGAKDINDHDRLKRSFLSIACYEGNTAVVQTLLRHKVDVRKEKKLICGNADIINFLDHYLRSSVKHRAKIETLKALEEGELSQIGEELRYFSKDKNLSIGKGCRGTNVYAGIMDDGSEVAVKMILKQACRERGENERNILDLINQTPRSPYIVSYRKFLEDHDFMYLIIDLCEETLEEHVNAQTIGYLRQRGPRIIKEILYGLRFLHGQGILHRDLKPTNVLVDIDGRMRLADFGISRVLNENETTVRTAAKGTEDWMPAEVILCKNQITDGRYKKKSDIQAAGMVAFYTLTRGIHPFGDYRSERMTNIVAGNPVHFPKLDDAEARDFISRLIRHNIHERPYVDEALRHNFMVRAGNSTALPKPIIQLRSDIYE